MKMKKSVLFDQKNLKINIWKIKKYSKVKDHWPYIEKYRGAAHSIRNLKYNVSKKKPVAFHNGSNYDYYLVEVLKKKFTCLGENTE